MEMHFELAFIVAILYANDLIFLSINPILPAINSKCTYLNSLNPQLKTTFGRRAYFLS